MKYFTLYNGDKIPAIGMGTYKIKNQKDMENAIEAAFENGYEYFDTAAFYDNEEILGLALKNAGEKRSNYKIATKVWPYMYGEDLTKRSIENSLKNLKTDYIDIIHLHWYGKYFEQSWKVFEDYKREGIVKNIAVCNFSKNQMEELLKIGQKPVINQLESHPHLQDESLIEYLKENQIMHQAWSPIAKGKNGLLEERVLLELAKKYNKTAAQIALRWNIERNTMVIPKSIHKDRIKENISIFDFSLEKDDLKKIKSIDKNKRYSHDPEQKEWLIRIGRS